MAMGIHIPEKDLKELKKQLNAASRVAISGHTNPDGDCIGSCLGLCTYLNECFPGIMVDVYLDPIKEKFQFLKNAKKIRQEKEEIIYDIYFSLDCSDPERLMDNRSCFEKAAYKVCVDHHITNQGFGDLRFIYPEASSTCEVLYHMFEDSLISTECAQALYMGIVHDTGVFKHSNTTRAVMETAGALIEKGINTERIIDETFYTKTYLQNQILGRALMESILILDGRMIFSVVTKRDFEFYGIDSGDLDGIIDQLRVTKGVECALLLYEKDDKLYKASMRSNDKVNVSKIAKLFGGGGHVKAAGCTMNGDMRDVVMNIAFHVEHQLNQVEDL